MISAVVGILVCGVSLIGIFIWREELLIVLKGFIPLSFLFGGLIAVIMGISKRKKGGDQDNP